MPNHITKIESILKKYIPGSEAHKDMQAVIISATLASADAAAAAVATAIKGNDGSRTEKNLLAIVKMQQQLIDNLKVLHQTGVTR